ncbi:MAG: hypothetical protein EOR29_25210 [Mesorhizobium sp.]|nr:MAG: hypothetical protein EOR29_25210 [Mesorhizobium sp.]TIR08857.1 MAG: hypothetical protein E5X37_17805 [Mesorhizobium sp.]
MLRRRSEIVGAIGHLEAKATSLRDDLHHLDASLRILGYAGDQARLPVRKACSSGLFHRKELTRLVTALLRDNPDGLQASEIAIAIARDKGWSTDEKPFVIALTDKVSRTLSKLKSQERAGFEDCEAGFLWRPAGPAASSRITISDR